MRRLRQGYDTIRSKLTGIGLFGASASWTPAPSERATILRLFNFLENRRVLYVPMNFEIPGEVDRSVIQIRDELTELLNLLPEKSRAANRVRHLRTASRKFLEGRHPTIATSPIGSGTLSRMKPTTGMIRNWTG